MAKYRYRPKDNRTPVADPELGHLDYDGVYTDPRCAEDPRFEEIKTAERHSADKPKKAAVNKRPDAGDTGDASRTESAAKPPGASNPGRS